MARDYQTIAQAMLLLLWAVGLFSVDLNLHLGSWRVDVAPDPVGSILVVVAASRLAELPVPGAYRTAMKAAIVCAVADCIAQTWMHSDLNFSWRWIPILGFLNSAALLGWMLLAMALHWLSSSAGLRQRTWSWQVQAWVCGAIWLVGLAAVSARGITLLATGEPLVWHWDNASWWLLGPVLGAALVLVLHLLWLILRTRREALGRFETLRSVESPGHPQIVSPLAAPRQGDPWVRRLLWIGPVWMLCILAVELVHWQEITYETCRPERRWLNQRDDPTLTAHSLGLVSKRHPQLVGYPTLLLSFDADGRQTSRKTRFLPLQGETYRCQWMPDGRYPHEPAPGKVALYFADYPDSNIEVPLACIPDFVNGVILAVGENPITAPITSRDTSSSSSPWSNIHARRPLPKARFSL